MTEPVQMPGFAPAPTPCYAAIGIAEAANGTQIPILQVNSTVGTLVFFLTNANLADLDAATADVRRQLASTLFVPKPRLVTPS